MSATRAANPYSKVRLDRLVGEIESAIVSGDRARQSQIVRRSADLLVKYWSCLPPAGKPAFDVLLQNLAGEIDADARRAFASRLADLRRGPPRTIARLARDPDGLVAAALLERGRSLQPDDLRKVAESCSNVHRRAAARRAGIGPDLTDLLLVHGDLSVAVAVAENPGAGISQAGFASLVRQAARSERLSLLLLAHAGLGEQDHAVLQELTLRRARAALDEEFTGDGPALQTLLDGARAAIARCEPHRADRFRASVAFIASSFAATPPKPDQIRRWLALNRIEDVLAALAHAAGLPIEPVVAAYDARADATFATMVRGVAWPWEILKTLLTMKHLGEDRIDVLNAAYEIMRNVSPLCARRLIRLTAARDRVGAFGGTGELVWPELQTDGEPAARPRKHGRELKGVVS